MRKQTKKVLSWVLAGAMALSLVPAFGANDKSAEARTVRDTTMMTMVEIAGLKDQVENFDDIKVSDVKLSLDGESVEVDQSKILSGDLEDKGNYRVELYNCYGGTKEAPAYDTTKTWKKDMEITFTISGLKYKEGAEAKEACVVYTNKDWSFSNWNPGSENATDAKIDKDGTYTVKLSNPGNYVTNAQDTSMMTMVEVKGLKDQVENFDDIKVSDVKLSLDGEDVEVAQDKVLSGDLEDKGNYRIELYNCYGGTKEAPAYDTTKTWSKEMAITFTISGLKYKEGIESNDAYVVYTNKSWGFSNWGAGSANATDAKITKDGTYTVKLTNTDYMMHSQDTSMMTMVEMAGLKDKVASLDDIKVSDVKLELDGGAVEVAQDKVLSGDLEDKGNYRIELYNCYGGTKEAPTFDTTKTWSKSMKITFTLSGVKFKDGVESADAYLVYTNKNWDFSNWGAGSANATDAKITGDGTYTVELNNTSKVEEDELAPVDPDATPTPEPTEEPKAYDEALWATKGIHAYLSYQMDGTWDYRNGYKPNDLGKQDTYDYIKASGDTANFKATDVLLTKDGEYTVAISGIDLTAATKYNLLSIATDLSAKTEENPDGAYADVKLSVTSLKVDGVEVAKDLSLVQKADELYYYYPLINKWNADDKGPLFDLTDAEELAIPENSIEVTFKVTGLKAALNDLKNGTYKDPETGENVKNDSITQDDIDASDGVLPTPSVQPSEKPNVTPAPTNSPAPTKAPQAPKKGVKVTSGKVVYKVTKAATAKKAGTLSLVGLSKAGKKASSLSAPATAKINGYSYKVTSIGKNAFKGANAKTISLSKNIKSIPAGAFANCKKLSTLKVKAKLTKVAKKAFKGCKKTIKVKGASKKVTKANVKKLKKSGYKKFK